MFKKSILIPGIFMGALLALWNSRPIPDAMKDYLVKAVEIKQEGLQVQFLGNTNILLSDGKHSILTDGFFSRPAAHTVLLGKVAPKMERIKWALKRAGIDQLDAVIPVHSHYDHAMDAPAVAELTGAMLIGSSSTLQIGAGFPLGSDQMMLAPLDELLEIGDFKIRFLKSRHWQYPDAKMRDRLLDQDIETPLKTPASIYDYKEGISYSILIEHKQRKIAIQGSAGYVPNLIKDFDADLLFLAIAGIEVMDKNYQDDYQQYVIEALRPETIVPIHWDDMTVPLDRGLKTNNLLFNLKFGSDLEKAFAWLEEENPARKIALLSLWDRYSVKQLLEI